MKTSEAITENLTKNVFSMMTPIVQAIAAVVRDQSPQLTEEQSMNVAAVLIIMHVEQTNISALNAYIKTIPQISS